MEECSHNPKHWREGGCVDGDMSFCEKCGTPMVMVGRNKWMWCEPQTKVVYEPAFVTVEYSSPKEASDEMR
jgi:hypothetical protein